MYYNEGYMTFILFIGGLFLLVRVSNLSSRVQRLERLMEKDIAQRKVEGDVQPSLSEKDSAKIKSVPASLLDYTRQQLRRGESVQGITQALQSKGWSLEDIDQAFETVGRSSQPAIELSKIGPSEGDKFIAWLKEDWLLKLGAFLLLVGFGWLTTYAFLNNWIGPMGRIVLGIVAGTLFLILGSWRIQKYVQQGGVFLVLGSTVILLTVFAARAVYGFFTPISALALMFLSTAFVALSSVRYRSRPLALVSLILAGVAPLLTSSPTADYVGLFSYLLIVILGTVWVVAVTEMRELTLAGLLLVAFHSFLSVGSSEATDTVLLFVYAFAAIFSITNTLGILKAKGKEITSDLFCASANGLFLLSWIMIAAPEEWKSLIICAWMVVFAVGGFLTLQLTNRREPFYAYLGVSVAMLAAATSVQLDGASLTIAYIIESGMISLIAYAILKDLAIAERLSLLLIGPVVLSFESMSALSWELGVFHKDFFVLLTLGTVLFGLGLFFFSRIREEKDEIRQLNAFLLNAGSFYLYVLLWLSLGAGFQNDNLAVLGSLVVYTIIGLIAYFYGLANEKKGIRLHGVALIVFVIGRLFLIDVWSMELAGRIVTFFAIGALLVSTAFLGRGRRKSDSSVIL